MARVTAKGLSEETDVGMRSGQSAGPRLWGLCGHVRMLSDIRSAISRGVP